MTDSAPASPKQQSWLSREAKWVLIAAGVLIVAIVAAGLVYDHHKKSPAQKAEAACESLVKDRLKSPSTAKFSGESASDIVKDLGLVTNEGDGKSNGTLTVLGSVDSQNGFGATVRSTWICTVTKSGTAELIALTQS